MIWRSIFPPEGGGSMRRFIKIKRSLLEQRWLDRPKVTSPGYNLQPLTLFDFSRHDDAVDAMNSDISGRKGGWRCSDDETIGGYSGATLKFIRSRKDLVLHTSQSLGLYANSSADTPTLQTEELMIADEPDFIPFLRFEGIIDTTLPDGVKAKRSGFCAIRSPEFVLGGADLGDFYNALEIKCRPDARNYTVNLGVHTFFPDDLYQGFITQPQPQIPVQNNDDGEWNTLILPFKEFILTALGRKREVQRKLDGGISIKHIGITLADGVDGDFEFDLARIRAVNYYRGRLIGED